MSWFEALPGTLTMAALMVVPGWAMARVLGLRGLGALGPAPALSIAASGGWAVVYPLLGIGWSLWTQLAGFALAVAVAALVGDRCGTAPWRGRTLWQPGPLGRAHLALLAAALAAGVAIHVYGMARGMTAPAQPQQTWDGVFHLGAIQTIRETGNASTFGGLAPMYDAVPNPYYPAVWHGMVAVAPFFDPVSVSSAANASSLVMGLIWPLSAAGLARVLWPGRPAAAAVAPLLAISFVTLPVALLTVLGQWPYALAHTALPGVLTLLALAIRNLPARRPTLALGIAALVAALGVALAHGSAAFTVALLAGPVIAVAVVRQVRAGWAAGRRRATWVAVGLCAAFAAAVAITLAISPAFDMVLGFERDGAENYWGVLGSLLVDHPLVYSYDADRFSTYAQAAVTALALYGSVLAWRAAQGRWLVVGLLSAIVLTMLAAGPPENPLRVLAGPWYTQPSRLVVLVAICAVPLASLALATLARQLAGAARLDARWRSALAAALVAALVVATGALRVDLKTAMSVNAYVPNRIAWGTMLHENELALIDRAPAVLPDDALVIGDPFAGAAYLYPLAGVDVVYRQLGQWDSDDLVMLGTSFNDIYTDPAICAALNRLGVTHYYLDTRDRGPQEYQQKYSYRSEGLALFRPAEGFTEVDREGSAALYRIDYCARG